LRYGCEDILLRWLYDLNARWLAFGFEREIYIMPGQMALGFIPYANIIGPTSSQHEEHSITFCIRQFLQLWFPVRLVPRVLLQTRAHKLELWMDFLAAGFDKR